MSAFEAEARSVSKSFGAVHALRDVSFGVGPGEARGLIGENGAGKSTLIKILSGALQPDTGELLVGGEAIELRSPHAALEQGIGTVHQRNFLVPSLTVLQNVELGHERRLPPIGWLARRPRERSVEALRFVGLERRLSVPVASLSLADRQLVAIARAVSRGSRLMIFDEPTAVLSPVETASMFDVIDRLRAAGTALIYVTHRLEELPRLVSGITVMRDGAIVAEAEPATPVRDLVEMMAGHEVLVQDEEQKRAAQRRVRSRPADTEPLVSVRGLTDRDGAFADVSFDLAPGEILSLVGLPDSGTSEIVGVLSGARRAASGDILLEGRRMTPRSPRGAVRRGIGYVSGDRGQKGVIPNFSVRRTATISSLDRVGTLSVIQPGRDGRLATRFLDQCQVRAASSAMSITALSGGNQQKALMARMLAAEPKVLLFEDPTAGVDVAGREALYDLVVACCERGHAVIWTSSDLREVTTVCDRALVMWRGSVVREIPRDGLTVRALMAAQFNQDAPDAMEPAARER
jgi:ABC-type sugar transport system ATPase subunit